MTYIKITQETPIQMLAPPYRVVNTIINSFVTLVNVAPDGSFYSTLGINVSFRYREART